MGNWMLNKMLQRKFWVALAGAVALFAGDGLGLEPEGQILGGIIMAVWVVVEGACDFISIRTQSTQLRQMLASMQAPAQVTEKPKGLPKT